MDVQCGFSRGVNIARGVVARYVFFWGGWTKAQVYCLCGRLIWAPDICLGLSPRLRVACLVAVGREWVLCSG